VFGLWGLYLLLPIVATVLYSVASVWRNRALPDGYTLRWWTDTLREPRVLDALLRSLGLAAITVVLVAGIVLPPLYWAYVRNPQLRTVMQVAALLPFALPFVVLAYGMKNFAGATALTRPYEASWQLLILGHVALSFPFFLWPVDGALAGCGVRRLHEAAEMSGAGPVQTLLRVVIPNIRTGLLTGAMLCFATSFGEYSIAKVITGSSFETLPVWQVAALSDTRGNPNGVAVMAVFTFVVMFAVSVVIAVAAKGQPVGMVGSGTESRRTRAQRSNP
jgi:putative spermidine/putrescine transport system permease protein